MICKIFLRRTDRRDQANHSAAKTVTNSLAKILEDQVTSTQPRRPPPRESIALSLSPQSSIPTLCTSPREFSSPTLARPLATVPLASPSRAPIGFGQRRTSGLSMASYSHRGVSVHSIVARRSTRSHSLRALCIRSTTFRC